jgi:hypothetical protein
MLISFVNYKKKSHPVSKRKNYMRTWKEVHTQCQGAWNDCRTSAHPFASLARCLPTGSSVIPSARVLMTISCC